MSGPVLNPTVHELKCWPEFFEYVLNKTKPFELRTDDRDYKVGDILWQREWEPGGRYLDNNPEIGYATKQGHSGREDRQRITYILRGNTKFLQPGIVALGIAPIIDPNAERMRRLELVAQAAKKIGLAISAQKIQPTWIYLPWIRMTEALATLEEKP